jgi:enterochelin esterase family protein
MMSRLYLAFVLFLAGVSLAAPAAGQNGGVVPLHGVRAEHAIDTRPGIKAGIVEEFFIHSRHYPRPRRIWVYTPPGYAPTGHAPYDLVVAFDGGEYLSDIPLPMMLDTLQAMAKTTPMVAVMIDDSTAAVRLDDLANRASFAAFLGDEVMPWVQQHWNVTRDPHHTIVTGSSAGGLASAYVALMRPDLFGKVLSQSGAFWRGAEASNDAPFEWLTAQYAARPKQDIRFFLDVGGLENGATLGGSGPVFIDANRRLRDVLRKKGYTVAYTEVRGGVHAPITWNPRLQVGIVALAGWGAAN